MDRQPALFTPEIPGSEKSDTISSPVLLAFRARKTSVRSWARARGLAPATVYWVIGQWVDHPDRRGRLPLGGVNRAILRALHDELGPTVVPLPPTDPEEGRAAA